MRRAVLCATPCNCRHSLLRSPRGYIQPSEPRRVASYPSALQSCSLAHSSKECHLTSGCSLRNASISAL
jgi:hypothetical protein